MVSSQSSDHPQQKKETQASVDSSAQLPQVEPEKELFTWVAPNRPFKRRTREYYTTIAVIVILISLILFFAGQFLPIAVVVSIAFVSYVLASVPPENVQNAITTYGIHSDQTFHFWEEMGRFWFTTKYGHHLLHVETARFPGRMTLLIAEADKEKVKKILVKYLIMEKPLPSFLEKAADKLEQLIPLENEKVSPQAKK